MSTMNFKCEMEAEFAKLHNLVRVVKSSPLLPSPPLVSSKISADDDEVDDSLEDEEDIAG